MNAKDALRANMDLAEMVLKTYVSDLTDAELMTRPVKGNNHLAWQLGHLISSEQQLLSGAYPGSAAELPAGFKEQHDKSTAASDDASKFLTKQRYIELFDKQRAATKAALERIPDSDLDKPGPESMKRICPTIGSLFNLIASHPMMHAGQFATARRTLGKPVLI